MIKNYLLTVYCHESKEKIDNIIIYVHNKDYNEYFQEALKIARLLCKDLTTPEKSWKILSLEAVFYDENPFYSKI